MFVGLGFFLFCLPLNGACNGAVKNNEFFSDQTCFLKTWCTNSMCNCSCNIFLLFMVSSMNTLLLTAKKPSGKVMEGNFY